MKRILPILFLAACTVSCTDIKENSAQQEKITQLQTKLDSIIKLKTEKPMDTQSQIATFLTFQKGNAEQAMNHYIALFDNSKIENMQRWGKEGPGKEGTIMHATFTLNGKLFMCSDSPAIHDLSLIHI